MAFIRKKGRWYFNSSLDHRFPAICSSLAHFQEADNAMGTCMSLEIEWLSTKNADKLNKSPSTSVDNFLLL